jgi:hypothetical protein
MVLMALRREAASPQLLLGGEGLWRLTWPWQWVACINSCCYLSGSSVGNPDEHNEGPAL